MLEQQNNQQVDALHSKVSRLKELTIDINDEVLAQNEMLLGLDGSFDETGTFMGISSRRLKSLVNSGNGRLMCYLVGFAVTVFLVIYMLIR